MSMQSFLGSSRLTGWGPTGDAEGCASPGWRVTRTQSSWIALPARITPLPLRASFARTWAGLLVVSA
jgi:hypothetical protein